ncbi:MAG: hypothetical protein AUK53_00675 [Betaproteobacteria bacterium CG2_30_59_46]|nr:MAG: hypothetical protein AUK53_00675 [Betaproteobacteria bacterium CG2_30_59_46]PIQ12795.1 MAG: hypothetical protein COW70_08140 [Hydrogenophilales bacterium CG18_big_fil_WC_8_21_14_2_50_58_12]PIX99168.1 MAG: hypothetical protein COZ23_11915 [Hydrogenophilales bacterium CG_4_10_14_3_um_filter_58_23]PJB07669.1 MAG: hypothetical protein CO125_04230 [Hydrogenophilales bacterium CG_4_9_14_3_um_filter_59_35]
MAEHNEIFLLLTPDVAEIQCQETIKQARNASHALAALIALQSFILATARPSNRFTPAYEAVKAVVEKHAAEIRMRILAENAEALAEAIRERNRPEITHIHSALSRNGFWQAAQQAIGQFGPDDLAASAAWVKDWCSVARTQAQTASGYPDALNFSKAGIAATEYAAMTEISHYFTDVVG